jgi:ubiquinol-cytochrome c reductase iron-sulfur subunit
VDSPTLPTGETANEERRDFLVKATLALGTAGLAAAAVPFVLSWEPSERARALGAPAEIDTKDMAPGTMGLWSWREQPIIVVRRSAAELRQLGNHDKDLKDPHSLDSIQPPYARNDLRSRQANLLIVIGVCTHLGCLPKGRLVPGQAGMEPGWPGGFYCPCHGSRFDLAGRVFKGSPASRNLDIPPYAISPMNQVIVGLDHANSGSQP